MQGLERQGVLVVTGQKGSGKSNLVRAMLQRVPRWLAIDMHGDYGGCIIREPESLSAYLNARGSSGFFGVSYRDNGEHGYSWSQVLRMLRALEDTVLVLEEAQVYMLQAESDVDWFFAHGRHRRVSLVVVAQRPYQLGPLSRSQADVVVTFRQHEQRDLDWLETKRQGAALEVAQLGDYEWTYALAQHDELEALLNATSEEIPAAPPAVQEVIDEASKPAAPSSVSEEMPAASGSSSSSSSPPSSSSSSSPPPPASSTRSAVLQIATPTPPATARRGVRGRWVPRR